MLAIAFCLLSSAHAGSITVAESARKRPPVYPTDVSLSSGAVENFKQLYSEPGTVAAQLQPVDRGQGQEHLVITNDTRSFVDVSVGDVRIGQLIPLSDGLVRDVAAGTYQVTFTFPNGLTRTRAVATVPTLPAQATPQQAPAASVPGDVPAVEDRKQQRKGKVNDPAGMEAPPEDEAPTPAP